MGKTCEPKAFSFQCMTEFTTNKKIKKKKQTKHRIISANTTSSISQKREMKINEFKNLVQNISYTYEITEPELELRFLTSYRPIHRNCDRILEITLSFLQLVFM